MNLPELPPLACGIIDSHAHLAEKIFQGIMGEVIERAKKGGLTFIIVPGDSLESSREALKLSEEHPDFLRAAVGLHPYQARFFTGETEQELASLSGHPLCVAIGEIGLDYRKDGTDPSPPPLQREAFSRQMDLARKLEMPAIIHCRNAYSELISFLSLEKYKGMKGVVHCFSGTRQDALALADLGWNIGFTGTLTFKNAAELREAAAALPLEKILIETDSPYLTPHPYRGLWPNEPVYVRLVAETLAQSKNLPLETVCRATTQNTIRLFDLFGGPIWGQTP